MIIFKKIFAIARLCRFGMAFITVPYAITAAFLAAEGIPDLWDLFYVVLASAAAYSAGCIANALADQDVDGANPRTATRPLITKELSRKEAYVLLAICGILLLFGTAMINPFYILLLPFPGLAVAVYCFCKRFTWLGHFLDSFTHIFPAFAAWVVFSPDGWWDWRAYVFSAFVFFWTLSLDLIYSSQDMEYDRSVGLHSIPARFGKKVTYAIVYASDVCAIATGTVILAFSGVGTAMIVGACIAVCCTLLQHILILINIKNEKHSFVLNQIYSVVVFIASILDKI